MVQGKQGATVLKGSPQQLQNPIDQIQTRYKHLENGFKLWLSKQSIAVEAAVVTTTAAAKCFTIGCFATFIVGPPLILPRNLKNLTPHQRDFIKRPLIPARNLAILVGANAAIHCVLKRWRGKEDLLSCVAAAFGSGAMFSLACGMGGPNIARSAVTSVTCGLMFAITQGWCFEVSTNKMHLFDSFVNQNYLVVPPMES